MDDKCVIDKNNLIKSVENNNLDNGFNDKFYSVNNSNNKKSSMKKKSTVVVDNDVDLMFRKLAASKFNFCRGWYSKAINEAILDWIENNK